MALTLSFVGSARFLLHPFWFHRGGEIMDNISGECKLMIGVGTTVVILFGYFSKILWWDSASCSQECNASNRHISRSWSRSWSSWLVGFGLRFNADARAYPLVFLCASLRRWRFRPSWDFGYVAFSLIGFRWCRFRLIWISAMTFTPIRFRRWRFRLNWISAMTLSPPFELGYVAFASIGFRRWCFSLNWLSAMTLLPHLDFEDATFASMGFRRCHFRLHSISAMISPQLDFGDQSDFSDGLHLNWISVMPLAPKTLFGLGLWRGEGYVFGFELWCS